jgi:hypothetical protein
MVKRVGLSIGPRVSTLYDFPPIKAQICGFCRHFGNQKILEEIFKVCYMQ